MKIKCGFEWHVQIDSGKLFCRCGSEIKQNENFIEIKRIIRPSFGEEGKIDKSAEFEGQKLSNIVYKFFNDVDCLVDADEEPPHEIDKNALTEAIKISYALNAYILKNLIFMRKTIVDGSNTTGFQRTAILSMNGEFKFREKIIKIDTISIEEDSARKEKEENGKTIYFLDRLGIPLVEIATGIIETDENEAKEIALEFGKFTRLFNVKRGIGTIRQDVNLSIEGGRRVELKGFQNIKEMDKVILNEAKRQESLIRIKEEDNYLIKNLSEEYKDITNLFSNSNSNLIKNAIRNKNSIIGIRLKGFKGILGTYLCEGKRLGGEISDYLKAKLNYGIIHSDELPGYGINEDEKSIIANYLECKDNDAFLFSICDANQAMNVVKTINERITSLLTDVPSEVRLVKDDNTTRFLRPMGGKDRMYVETDLPVIHIDESIIKENENYRGLNIESFKKSLGISEEYLEQLIAARKLDYALAIHKKTGAEFGIITNIAVEKWKFIKRKFGIEINNKAIEEIIKKVTKGEITKEGAETVMEYIAANNDTNIEKIIADKKLKKTDNKKLSEEIKKLIHNGQIDKIDSLIINLKDRLGPTFEASDAYRIAENLIKNEKK